MKKIIIIVLVLLIFGLGVWYFWGSIFPSDSVVEEKVPSEVVQQQETKSFVVEAKNFSFSPATITVKKGDTVSLTLKNMGGTHNLKIDEYEVTTQKINDGQEDTVVFVADKTGSFEYYCSVGNHRSLGVKGTLIVEE